MNPLIVLHNRWVILVCIWIVILGCAPQRTMVILIPDKNGNVGKAEVSSNGVNRILDTANQAAIVNDSTSAPEIIDKIDSLEIQSIFADALAAEPPEPKKFLLYFKSGTTQLSNESLALISEILDTIRIRQSRDISINGHTDRVGTDRFNLELSLQRARMMQVLLVKAGIDPKMLYTASHGEGNPLIQTLDNVAEPRNRRVEVIIR